MEKVNLLPNGQWQLEKMAQHIRPKGEQAVPTSKRSNPQNFGAKFESEDIDSVERFKSKIGKVALEAKLGMPDPDSGVQGYYNTKQNQAYINTAMRNKNNMANTEHHEHQHKILQEVANGLNITVNDKPINTSDGFKQVLLSQHLMSSSGIHPHEQMAVFNIGLGSNIDEGPHEFLANMVGFMNAGEKQRLKMMGFDNANKVSDLDREQYHTYISQDKSIKSAFKKMQNAMQDLHSSDSLHFTSSDGKFLDDEHHHDKSKRPQ
jgi:hypothetical protein